MPIIRLLILLFFLVDCSKLVAQKDTSATWIVKGGAKDQIEVWSAPIKIKLKHIPIITAIGGLTASGILFDEKIYSLTQKHTTTVPWLYEGSKYITYGGKGYTAIGIGSVFYLSGHLSKNNKHLTTGALCYEAYVQAGLIANIGKVIFSRKRPIGGNGINTYPDGQSKWHFFPGYLNVFQGDSHRNYSSFPSGHSTTAWAIATIIAKQYNKTKWIPTICYSSAFLVSISRVLLNNHWSSDIVVGAAIGYGVGHFLYKKRNNTHWTLFPSSFKKNISLTAVYNL